MTEDQPPEKAAVRRRRRRRRRRPAGSRAPQATPTDAEAEATDTAADDAAVHRGRRRHLDARRSVSRSLSEINRAVFEKRRAACSNFSTAKPLARSALS